jgi:hypothetical protein
MVPDPAHQGRRRRTWRALWPVTLVLVLSGCFQLREDLTVDRDGTLSGVVRVGIDRTVIAEDGENPVTGSLPGPATELTDLPGVEVSDYRDGDYEGREIRFEDVPISSLRVGDGSDLLLELSPDGGLTMRMSSPGPNVTAVLGDESAATPLDIEADVRIAVTFPGQVLASNGTEVRGSTVLWRYRTVGELTKAPSVLEAQWDSTGLQPGSAGTGGNPWWLVAAGGLAGSVVVVGVVRHRRPRVASSASCTIESDVPLSLPPAPVLQLGTGSAPPEPRARRWPPPPMHRERWRR